MRTIPSLDDNDRSLIIEIKQIINCIKSLYLLLFTIYFAFCTTLINISQSEVSNETIYIKIKQPRITNYFSQTLNNLNIENKTIKSKI